MMNNNVYQELINTGGGCMVLERIVLADDGTIYYLQLNDENFAINTYSVNSEDDLSDGLVYGCDVHWADYHDMLVVNNADYKLLALLDLNHVFRKMADDWITLNEGGNK